jgi:hypothetical protein
MKRLVTILAALLSSLYGMGQSITVTGTVTDPSGCVYQGGSGRAILQPSNQTWLVNNTNPVQTPIVINNLDAFGKFSVTLTNTSVIQPSSAGPEWQFQFCSNPSVKQQLCFTMTPLALTSSQDISTTIQAQAAPLNCSSGSSLNIETNGTPNSSQTLLNFVNSASVTFSNTSGGIETATSSGGGGGGGNPLLENCVPDQTGNSFYNVVSLTNWFSGHWEFLPSTTTYINCEIYIPTAQTGATIVLDVFDSDSTSGHTANLQTCDALITTGALQVGSLTCALAQTFTTTATAYSRSTLTFNVQSTLVNGGILVAKIAVAPTGTAPSGNLIVLPHFVL